MRADEPGIRTYGAEIQTISMNGHSFSLRVECTVPCWPHVGRGAPELIHSFVLRITAWQTGSHPEGFMVLLTLLKPVQSTE